MSVMRILQKGFSLIEMAVVLAIVGVLIGVGFTTLGAYLDNAKQSHTQSSLELTKRALLNYVTVNKHMPCPDTNDDGRITDPADRNGTLCNVYLGTIPYDDLGVARSIASDDWGNLFGYGVHQQAADAGVMALAAGSDALADLAGSYFYNVSAPDFDLDTPPTATIADSATESFTICKRTAADDCSGADDVEMEFIPAVVVAFNENGSLTNLNTCAASARSNRETVNCDGDMTLIKGVFNDATYDDQMVSISAYEIKQHALDIHAATSMTVTPNPGEYDGYDVIIKGDADSANDFNVADGVDNAFYIDKSDKDSTQEGSLNANVVFKAGNDTLYITGDVESGGNAKMGAGNDSVYVGQDVLSGAVINLGDSTITYDAAGNPILIDASTTDGKDVLVIDGTVFNGAKIYGDTGNDIITLNGIVDGLIDMGKDNDLLFINKTKATDLVEIHSHASITGGTGDDILFVEMTKSQWDANWPVLKSKISAFEYLNLEDASLLQYDTAAKVFQ